MVFFRKFAPVREGEEADVIIEAVGEKGDGIAKIKGFVIFVPGTKQGDNVKIRVTRVLSKVGFGEVVGKAAETPSAEQAEKPKKDSEEEEEFEETDESEEDSEEF